MQELLKSFYGLTKLHSLKPVNPYAIQEDRFLHDFHTVVWIGIIDSRLIGQFFCQINLLVNIFHTSFAWRSTYCFGRFNIGCKTASLVSVDGWISYSLPSTSSKLVNGQLSWALDWKKWSCTWPFFLWRILRALDYRNHPGAKEELTADSMLPVN